LDDSQILKDYDYLNFFTQFICFAVGVEYFGRKKINILLFFLIYFISGIVIKFIFFPEYIFKADYGSLYWTAPLAVSSIFFVNIIKKVLPKIEGKFLSYIIRSISNLGQKTYTSYMTHFVLIDIFRSQLEYLSFGVSFLILVLSTFSLTLLIENFTEKYWVQLGDKLIIKMNLR
jgi:hypothetical protein